MLWVHTLSHMQISLYLNSWLFLTLEFGSGGELMLKRDDVKGSRDD